MIIRTLGEEDPNLLKVENCVNGAPSHPFARLENGCNTSLLTNNL